MYSNDNLTICQSIVIDYLGRPLKNKAITNNCLFNIISEIARDSILAGYLIQEKQQKQNMDLFISCIIDWTTNFIDGNLHA
ncbi:unnamed protein product, partial [Rotaria sp. Silwood1]